MTIAKGDYMVIKRHGKIVTKDDGGSQFEFEVIEVPEYLPAIYEGEKYFQVYRVKLKVVE